MMGPKRGRRREEGQHLGCVGALDFCSALRTTSSAAPHSGKEGCRKSLPPFPHLRFAVSHRIYAKIVTMKQFRPTPIRPFVSPILALLSPEKCGWALKLSVCMREAAADRYSLQCSKSIGKEQQKVKVAKTELFWKLDTIFLFP